MAVKPENAYINRINSKLPLKRLRACANVRMKYPESQHIHYEKMNNPYNSGTADSWYSSKKDLWIEYKYLPKIPARASTVIDPMKLLSPLQQEWLRERHLEGRDVAVIIGTPEGGVLLRELTWEHQISTQQFRTLILSNNSLADWIRLRVT